VAGLLVDERHLRAPEAVGPINLRFQVGHSNPAIDEPGALPGANVLAWPSRAGNSQSSSRPPRNLSQAAIASRAGSVISNGTGLPAFCWIKNAGEARYREPSLTRSRTRSQAQIGLHQLEQTTSAPQVKHYGWRPEALLTRVQHHLPFLGLDSLLACIIPNVRAGRLWSDLWRAS
jgi:hypothetical protein